MRAQPLGWHSRGYLPHFDAPGLIQHITFHLADSLPADALARMNAQLDELPVAQQALQRRQRIQVLLDSGLGACVLANACCADIVEESLMHGDGSRYRLLAWVVMPNHVHVLIEQMAGWPLAKVVQSWKRHTSRRIHLLEVAECKAFGAGPLWQRDYWDRFIRNEQHLLTARHYIEQNPVMAGLVGSAGEWPWGSARFVGFAECNSAIPGRD